MSEEPSIKGKSDEGLADLVERCRRNEEAAVTELCERYRERLKRYIDKHMSSRGQAKTTSDDIVQEALIIITQKLPEVDYRGKQAFESWMLQICEGKIRDWIRHVGAAKRDAGREHVIGDNDGAVADRMNLLPSAESTPSRHAYTDEKGAIVDGILEQLSDRHSQVLRLRHLNDLSFAEIGEQMGISEDAAKALYGRAAVRFRGVAGRQPGVSDFTEFVE